MVPEPVNEPRVWPLDVEVTGGRVPSAAVDLLERGTTRLRAVDQLRAIVQTDAARTIAEMVAAGWSEADAMAATVAWWSRLANDAACAGVGEYLDQIAS